MSSDSFTTWSSWFFSADSLEYVQQSVIQIPNNILLGEQTLGRVLGGTYLPFDNGLYMLFFSSGAFGIIIIFLAPILLPLCLSIRSVNPSIRISLPTLLLDPWILSLLVMYTFLALKEFIFGFRFLLLYEISLYIVSSNRLSLLGRQSPSPSAAC